MKDQQCSYPLMDARRRMRRATLLIIAFVCIGCGRSGTVVRQENSTLRVAVSGGQMASSDPGVGTRQITQNLSIESLATFSDDGRPRPALAADWTVSDDRLSVTIRLRDHVVFHDGTPLTSTEIASVLSRNLPTAMGPAFDDIDRIVATAPEAVKIRFRRPSGFNLELLEAQIAKPGNAGIGTGPYKRTNGTEMVANDSYYLGRPNIARVVLHAYPTVRAAWADMLRDRNDVLYEVGADALESLKEARKVAQVFTFMRRYQYLLLLNTAIPVLKPPSVRRAMNMAINRDELVRDALNGQGVPSLGPVSPRHWALDSSVPRLTYDPAQATSLLHSQKAAIRFTCLVPPDYERIALVVKRQLEAAGVQMDLVEMAPDQIMARMIRQDFDASLLDAVSGPTMFRLYRFWHSGEQFNPAGIGTRSLDGSLDQVRHAASDDDYRAGVAAFQRAVLDDPPAIFLAWSEAARAVSTRFQVPVDPTRPDPISTLRLWRPAAPATAGRN